MQPCLTVSHVVYIRICVYVCVSAGINTCCVCDDERQGRYHSEVSELRQEGGVQTVEMLSSLQAEMALSKERWLISVCPKPIANSALGNWVAHCLQNMQNAQQSIFME